MRSDSHGIQQLLTAEKRADEKIALARKRKAAHLKQAKDEAQAEVRKFREEKEKEFKEYEAKFRGSRENIAMRIESETNTKLQDMQKSVAVNKGIIIKSLLEKVWQIEPKLHENFRLNQTL